jgi:adenylate cyclase
MKRVTVDQIAEWAGVEPTFVARLIELAILETDDEGLLAEVHYRTVRIVRALEEAALPLEGLSQAMASGALSFQFTDNPSYTRWTSLSDVTFRELSEETGVPLDVLMAIREATGSPPPGPDDRLRQDEMAIVPLVRFQHDQGFRPAVIERALRVTGDSLRRVAETESDWWRSEVMMPILEAGSAPDAMIRASNELSPVISDLSDAALMAIYHGQQAKSWMRNILEGFESALAEAGIQGRPERVPAICFLDLTGYSRLTEERGDEVALDMARRLSSLVQRNSAAYGGTAIKWLGDGVMFHFPEPAKGVQAALDMVVAAREANLPPAHVGLHAGPVLFQEGDYFGRTVNITSRVGDYARPGEVLVTQDVVDACRGAPIEFTSLGPVELKGVSQALRLYRAAYSDLTP